MPTKCPTVPPLAPAAAAAVWRSSSFLFLPLAEKRSLSICKVLVGLFKRLAHFPYWSQNRIGGRPRFPRKLFNTLGFFTSSLVTHNFVPLRLGVVCMAAGRAPTAGPWGARPRCWQTLGKDLNCNSDSPCGLGGWEIFQPCFLELAISESRPFPTLRRSKLVAGSQDSPSFSRGVCVANTESAYIIFHHSFESHLVIRIGGIPSIHNWPGYFFWEPSNCFQGMTSSKFGLTTETTAMNFRTSSDIPEWIQMAQKCKTGGWPWYSYIFRHISTEERHQGPSRRWQEALLVVGAMRSTGGADRRSPSRV